MRAKIKKIARENFGLRGWSLEEDGEKKWYLTKFDDEDNDDEYRFYFFIKEDGLQIVRRIKIIRYKYKENVELDNPYYIQAEKILNKYWEANKEIHLQSLYMYK